MMNLEVGKTYENSLGVRWTVTEQIKEPMILQGCFRARSEDGVSHVFTRTGFFWNNGSQSNSDLNLITEVVTPDTPFPLDDFPEPMVPLPNDPESTPTTLPLPSPRSLRFHPARYDELVAETFQTIINLGKLKGGEYAANTDRLDNFRRHGTRLNLPMEVIWSVYVGKHLDAINTYINDLQTNNTKRTRLETLSGRVDDIIVYMLLFKAMLEEREREEKNTNAS